MKTVATFDPQPAVSIAAFSRSDYITLHRSESGQSGSGVPSPAPRFSQRV